MTHKKDNSESEKMPQHIAFICDGNRRWARIKGLPTLMGHREGVEAIKRVVKRASEIGLKNLTFFCFSTENFNRSDEEVKYLFNLFKEIAKLKKNLVKYGYKFHHTGDRSLLSQDILDIIDDAEKDTENGTNGTINIAFAYGGRNDIVNATKKILRENLDPESITEESFKKHERRKRRT